MAFRIRIKLLEVAYKVKRNLSGTEDFTLPYFLTVLAVLSKGRQSTCLCATLHKGPLSLLGLVIQVQCSSLHVHPLSL